MSYRGNLALVQQPFFGVRITAFETFCIDIGIDAEDIDALSLDARVREWVKQHGGRRYVPEDLLLRLHETPDIHEWGRIR